MVRGYNIMFKLFRLFQLCFHKPIINDIDFIRNFLKKIKTNKYNIYYIVYTILN